VVKQTLGSMIRTAREDKGTLRSVAQQLHITPSYLSDIELDRRVPSEDTLRRLAGMLNLSFDDLMVYAGRVGECTHRYIERHPTATKLLRHIAAADLSEAQLQELIRRVDELGRL
jgi:transcriptional regulator with XRE-family HTH domain